MIDSMTFERLRSIGLTPAVVQQLMTVAPPGAESALMRVTEVHRETVVLQDGRSEYRARALPRLVHSLIELLAAPRETVSGPDGAGVGKVLLTVRDRLMRPVPRPPR